VTLNALPSRADAALPLAGATSATTRYARVRDGLRTFDALGDEIRRRQDAIQHAATRTGPAATAGVGAALAAYLATPAGQEKLEAFAHAAVGLVGRFFAQGPEQLPLPLA